MEVEAPPQRAFNQSQLSAEESEDDEKDEDTDLPATPLHPKPLGVSAEVAVQKYLGFLGGRDIFSGFDNPG